MAIVNDYEIVVAGTAGVLAPYAKRVTVVELDARMPVLSDVDVVLYDSFGALQGRNMDLPSLLNGHQAKVLVFSWNTSPDLVDAALGVGAHGYVSKGVSGEELVLAIERVQAGEEVTPATAGFPDGDEFGRWPGHDHGLSPREAEVLALICQGMSNQEIAGHAFIGINTVKTYVRTLYAKIGAESRSQAVLWGVDHGFRPDRSRHLSG